MSTPRTEVVRQAFARCDWLESLGYENCASDQRRALTHLESELAACQAELATEKLRVESLKSAIMFSGKEFAACQAELARAREAHLKACQDNADARAEIAREGELLMLARYHMMRYRRAPSGEIICCCRAVNSRKCHYCVAGEIAERIDAALQQEAGK